MFYKVINLRTGEMLDGTFLSREAGENFIQYYINQQWENHNKILTDLKYKNIMTLATPGSVSLLYYKGEPFKAPEDKSYHFEVIYEVDNAIQGV
jgi:hypothetical protein